MDGAGKVTVLIGSQSNGQGHETAYTQIVSARLGIPAEDIEVVQGDSERISFGSGTGGSRSIPVGGAALSDTAERVIEKARAKAAECWKRPRSISSSMTAPSPSSAPTAR